MSKVRMILCLVAASAVAWISPAFAQDDDSFDSLLQDLDFLSDSNGEETAPETEPAEPADDMMMEDAGAADMTDDMMTEEPAETMDIMAEDDVESMDVDMVEEDGGMTDAEEADEGMAADEEGDEPAEPILSEGLAGEDLDKAELMARQEEVRRQAEEKEAIIAINKGLNSYARGEYAEALESLNAGLLKLPVRPETEAIHSQAMAAVADANYQLARDTYRDDPARARQYINAALANDPGNRRAQSLDKRIQAYEQKQREEAMKPTPPSEQARFVEKKKTVDQLLEEGKQLMDIEEYNDAERIFDEVLAVDEYNVKAMRFLRKIEEIKYERRSKEREASVAGMMEQVRDGWNPPRGKGLDSLPGQGGEGPIDVETPAQQLQAKMEEIIIPKIEFRQANINDVVTFLVDASQVQDPTGDGVNIILNLNIPGAVSGGQAAETRGGGGFGGGGGDDFFGGGGDDFGFGGGGGGFGEPAADAGFGGDGGAGANVPTVTLNLRRITLLQAIKYITEVADLKYRIEENAVIITPANVATGRILTKMYPVQPSIIDIIVQQPDEDTADRNSDFIEMGSNRATMQRADVKDFFERAGVPFPVGTSITYNPAISQLIVANTAENLETFERILSRLNVIPNQVEIEARFVEIAQSDLEELGLEWILTDNYEIATRTSADGVPQRIQMNADASGVSQGLRFFGQDLTTGSIDPISRLTQGESQPFLGGIASFASVLTNPELSVVVHALSQRGNSDLLSAPRVTTRSGVNAQIQVVQEIIYPTEFEVTEPTISASVTSISTTGGSAAGGLVTPPTVTPGSFETREVGVILNVTPTVGPDGYTIDLVLTPEVAELVDWIQYGSSISAGGQTFTYNIPQPVFASRNVTTSIVVWDGQTVVMGGLIREDLVKVDDKIPLLGDIPIIGRLFRNKGEYSRKLNLLIFVTARLVDPAGNPIHQDESIGAEPTAGGAVMGES